MSSTLKFANKTYLLIVPFLLTTWLFIKVVHLPFFSDDVLHFRYASQATALDIWTKRDVTALYYRPVVNFIIHLAYFGLPLSATWWHLVILWTHLINTALVGALARHLHLQTFGQMSAMLVFALFPFSVQGVVWVLAWFHPLVTMAVLVACVFGLRYLRGHQNALYPAWFAGMLAPFIHENGLFIGVFLGLMVLFAGRWQARRWLILFTPILISGAAYWMIRGALSGGGPSIYPQYLNENLAFFAQVISYPLQPIMAHLLGDSVVLAWVGFLIIACFGVLFFRRRALYLGLMWWLVASLPAAIALLPGYVVQSERLTYLAIPGVGLFYGVILDRLRWRWLAWASLAGLVVMFIIISRYYLDLTLALGRGYNDLIAAVAEHDEDTSLLIVNAPLQVDAEKLLLPLARVHAFMLHDYINFKDFLWLNTGKAYEHITVTQSATIKQRWPGYAIHYYGTQADSLQTDIEDHDVVFAFQQDAGVFRAGIVTERATSEADAGLLGDFNQTVRLVSATPVSTDAEIIRVGLHWQKLTDEPLQKVIFLHLLCDDVIIDQVDTFPMANLRSFAFWQAGEAWLDYHYLEFAGVDPDCLALRIGLYDPQDGQRATVTDENGLAVEEEWLTLPVVFVKTWT